MSFQPSSIQLLGHATFKVVTPEGKIIIIDPWIIDNPYIPAEFSNQPKIDLLLITHGHEDHMDIKIQKVIEECNPRVIANNVCRWFLMEQGISENIFEPMNLGGTIELLGVKVSMVNALHHSHVYINESKIGYTHAANGFVIKMSDNTTIYFAGDTCVFGDMKIIAEIYKPNIVVLPIGDRSVMSPIEAAYAVKLLGVKNVIPFHYATFPQFTKSAEQFIELTEELGDFTIHPLKAGEFFNRGKLFN